jgi:ERCC4-type nuclease
LLGSFGSICAISKLTKDELVKCPGLGPVKSENVQNFFRTSMITGENKS